MKQIEITVKVNENIENAYKKLEKLGYSNVYNLYKGISK